MGKPGPRTGLTHEQKLARYLAAPPRAVRGAELKRVKATRFFARVRCFDLACPRCGRIHSTQPHQDPLSHSDKFKAQALRPTKGWDPVKARLRCLGCGLRMTIGIVAWVGIQADPLPPPDSQPTSGEALTLTQEWKAYGAELRGEMVRVKDVTDGPLKGGGRAFGNLVVVDNPEDPSEPL